MGDGDLVTDRKIYLKDVGLDEARAAWAAQLTAAGLEGQLGAERLPLARAAGRVTAGPVWAQHDSEPLEGGWPTTQWFVDYLIADSHTLDIPAETPPGAYQIEVGMYDTLTHARLPVTDAQGQPSGDRVLLSGWRVVAP